MVLVMTISIKSLIPVLVTLLTAQPLLAGEWIFKPRFRVNETFSDNVNLSSQQKISSLVSQTMLDINIEYQSRRAQLKISHINTYLFYSQDHGLDTYYQSLTAQAGVSLWSDGPALIARSSIANISRDVSNNSVADLISGDTIESRDHRLGLQYNLANNRYSIDSSLIYQIVEVQDGIGESDGYTVLFNSKNGSATRDFFWLIDGQYNQRKNDDLAATSYTFAARLGVLPKYHLSPFVQYSDEQTSGDILSPTDPSMASWGPGIRWQLSTNITLDLGYNYVKSKQLTDDYLAGEISWQASRRTSISAVYNKRFFGESYTFDLKHQTKRLSNSISYDETIEVFGRHHFKQVPLGNFWCPINNEQLDPHQCLITSNTNVNVEQYQLVTLSRQQLVEDNEFSINKTFLWQSNLTLSRTDFSWQLRQSKRESLSTALRENSFRSHFSVSRQLTRKSNVGINFNFTRNEFDATKINGLTQIDYYRWATVHYTRHFSQSLSSGISLQYLQRSSSSNRLTYQEVRLMFNLAKEF
jgi:uncharacterized protein (PEP-CTERM system associated)